MWIVNLRSTRFHPNIIKTQPSRFNMISKSIASSISKFKFQFSNTFQTAIDYFTHLRILPWVYHQDSKLANLLSVLCSTKDPKLPIKCDTTRDVNFGPLIINEVDFVINIAVKSDNHRNIFRSCRI